jgi:4-amino-4-deoxy-L-arabinose transferase-like glycosyltransferase
MWLGVTIAVALSLALRLPFIGEPSFPDEGGYLLAAQHWRSSGPNLYGDFFVDRPPLLMLFWRAAAVAGGVEAARWAACVLVGLFVVCAAWAGRLVGGDRGGLLAAFTAAALASGPVLGAHEVDGELLAAPVVMLSCALALTAVRSPSPRRQAWASACAGGAGVLAVLVKQNFVDALGFLVVLVVASALTRALSWRAAVRMLGWATAAGIVVVASAIAWASSTAPGVGGLVYAMYGFRSDAERVIFSQSLTAPEGRLSMLWSAALVSGLLAVGAVFVVAAWARLRRRDPVHVAVVVMLLIGMVGVALGASYWVHYLIGLIPVSALAAATLGGRSRWLRRLGYTAVAFVVVSAGMTTATAVDSTTATAATDTALEQFLGAAGDRSDRVVITYGHANVIEASGLEPGYPYLWSLPMRTLDPDLRLLIGRLSGRSAPTWFVQWDDLDSWGIDTNGLLAATVRADYRPVAAFCGVEVYLHDGRSRPLPAVADPCSS